MVCARIKASCADFSGLRLPGAAHEIEIDQQEHQLLADIVVQVARNPRALGFLRAQQPGAEVANAIVARAQLGPVRAKGLFGLPPPRSSGRAGPQSAPVCAARITATPMM